MPEALALRLNFWPNLGA